MTRRAVLDYEFASSIPDTLKDGTLYVSMEYGTVAHKCCCGCGNEVVTPLSPTDWKLTFDGISISIYPSIGNWGFKCQSHYWIDCNKVRWSDKWSESQIAAGRSRDRLAKEKNYSINTAPPDNKMLGSAGVPISGKSRDRFWSRLFKWILR